MDHESRMEGVRRLLSPRIEQDDPNNADPVIKFPHLERIQNEIEKDLFQRWGDTSALPDIERQAEKCREENAAYCVMKIEGLKKQLEVVTEQTIYITACEAALQAMLSKEVDKNTQPRKVLKGKLSMVIDWRELLQKNQTTLQELENMRQVCRGSMLRYPGLLVSKKRKDALRITDVGFELEELKAM